jgi:hypothetical protein
MWGGDEDLWREKWGRKIVEEERYGSGRTDMAGTRDLVLQQDGT